MSDQFDIAVVRADPAESREPVDDQTGYGPGIPQRMREFYQGDPVGGHQSLTVGAVVAGFTVPDFARSAFCTVTTAAIRVTFDGTVPSAAVGHHFDVGEHFTVTGRNSLLGARFIREGAASAALDVDYFD